MRLKNKVIGISGAASGIGRACAVAAAVEGANVALGDIDQHGLTETARLVEETGQQAVSHLVDVTSETDQSDLVTLAAAKFGGLHGWVGSAGTGSSDTVLDHSRDEWRRVMHINVEGVFFGAQAAARYMREHDGGSLVNIASMYGQRAFPLRAAYCTSKAAVIMLTQVMALELAEHNIRVNAVAPGYTDTPLFQAGLVRDGQWKLDRMLERVPTGRLAHPDEIAKAAIFLLSDDASYVNGHTLTADGGWVINGKW